MSDHEEIVSLADQIADAGFYAAAFKMRALGERVERYGEALTHLADHTFGHKGSCIEWTQEVARQALGEPS